MKIVIRTVFFHFLCILIFALFYFNFKDDFRHQNREEFTLLDNFLLSTTI